MIRLMLILLVSAFFTGCGFLGEENSGSSDQATAENQSEGNNGDDQEVTRLKGAALLSRSFVDILGPDADINVSDPEEHLFISYKSNFGGNEGLSFGSTYANSLTQSNQMTSYFMALSYISYNAGLRCSTKQFDSKCDCSSKDSAANMLTRAVPWLLDIPQNEFDDLAQEFSGLCNENYAYAVSALLSSVAVAKRN